MDTVFQHGIPMRNILSFLRQIALTGENCLYNGRRVGDPNSMTLKSKGALRPIARLSIRVAMIGFLAAPVVLSQQQKSLPPVQTAQPPAHLDTKVDVNDRIAQLALATSAKQGDYVIGSGDLLGVEVFD